MPHASDTPLRRSHGSADFTRSGYRRAEAHKVNAADMDGATVYGHGEEKIGSISELKVGPNGKIADAVIDVGGFLGIGAHSVLVPLSQMTVLKEIGGSDVTVHMDAAKEKLEAMPKHDA